MPLNKPVSEMTEAELRAAKASELAAYRARVRPSLAPARAFVAQIRAAEANDPAIAAIRAQIYAATSDIERAALYVDLRAAQADNPVVTARRNSHAALLADAAPGAAEQDLLDVVAEIRSRGLAPAPGPMSATVTARTRGGRRD